MADRISVPDRTAVIQWVQNGAKAKDYPQVAPIFAKDCTGCHMASAKSIPPLTSYYNVLRVTGADTGTSFTVLAEVSHIHLFGISIIFLLTGAIFAFSTTPVWFRVCLVVIPYLSIILDIGSWWLTKYVNPAFFAYVVVIGGACMGLALAGQILISLWEMWIDAVKAAVGANRHQPAG